MISPVFAFLHLILLSMILSGYVHVAARGLTSLAPWLSNAPLYICATSLSFLCWRTLVGFRVLAVVNCAAMNTGVRVSFQITTFCGCAPRSGSAESCDGSIFRGYFFKCILSRNSWFVMFLKVCYTGSSVQFSRSVVSDSATPRTAARQDSLSITNAQSLLKLMSIESVIQGAVFRCRNIQSTTEKTIINSIHLLF